MLKKSLKYLIVAIVNLIILTIFLALWTEELELTFNNAVRPREFLKIIGFSLVSLIGIRMLVSLFRNRNITKTSFKIKTAALLTILISSYLYIDYSSKILHVILNREFRNQIAEKIMPSKGLANGTKADNLSIQEYQEITKLNWFPKLPGEAANINYTYEYDGFLPDYSFTLTYDLPEQMKVDTINYQNGDFSRYQTFIIIDNIKRVTFSEYKE